MSPRLLNSLSETTLFKCHLDFPTEPLRTHRNFAPFNDAKGDFYTRNNSEHKGL